MSEKQPQTEFKKTLGVFDGAMLVAGSMIGSGIFIVSADCARQVGSGGWLLALWVVAGGITLAGALCYGELAGMMPKAGGQFVYIERAWGRLPAFLFGWTVFAVIQTGLIAAVSMAFVKYAAHFFPVLGPENVLVSVGKLSIATNQLAAILIVIFLTWLNSLGVKNGNAVQVVLTIAKIFALVAMIVLGLFIGLKTDVFSQNLTNFWSPSQLLKAADGSWISTPLAGLGFLMVFGTALIGPLFSSDSWNNVTFIAGEMKNPRRDIPLSLLVGTGIVTVLYLLANVAYLALLPVVGDPTATDALGQGIQFATADRVGTAAASQIFGPTAAAIMAVLIMVSTFGCVNGLVLSGARCYYAMSKAGVFFKKAGDLNAAAVPAFALVLQAIWAAVLCLSGSYNDLLDYTTFASLLFFMITIGGIFVLRKREPDAERPYRVFAYPVLPAVYIVVAALICINLLIVKPENAGKGLFIVALGIPIYWLMQRRK